MSDGRVLTVAAGIVGVGVAVGVIFESWPVGLLAFSILAIFSATAPVRRA